MLLVLAENTRVGAAAAGGLVEPEPPPGAEPEAEPQPLTAISVEIAAKQNRIFEHVASEPIPLNLNDEACHPRLLLRVLLPRLVAASWNVFLRKGRLSKANIPTTTVLTAFSIPLRFPQARSWISLAARIKVTQILGYCSKLALKTGKVSRICPLTLCQIFADTARGLGPSDSGQATEGQSQS